MAALPATLLLSNDNNSANLSHAVAEWRKCWNQHQNDTLNAIAVHEKFHVLLSITTRMHVPAMHKIDRHNLEIGHHKYPEFKDTSEAFDVPITVSVKFEALVDEETLVMDNDETDVLRATIDTSCVASVVYVQQQQPREFTKSNQHHRVRMQTQEFEDFFHELQVVIDECQIGHMLFVNYQPSSDGVRLLALFSIVLAVLQDLQNIRPYLIDFSGEYIDKCISADPALAERCQTEVPLLVEIPEDLRRLTSHAINMCVGSGFITHFPEWLGEFTSLKVLRLVGSSRERDYLPTRFTRYSNKTLRNLPDSLWHMESLECLELALFMNLTTLPDSMAAMTSLTKLAFRNMFQHNDYCIPGSIVTLPALTHLSVSEIWEADIPAFLTAPRSPLLHLREFTIFQCQFLDALPDDFAMFPALERLDIDDMEDLRTLPPSVSSLKCLKFLRLHKLGNFGTDPANDSDGHDDSGSDEMEDDDENEHGVDEENDRLQHPKTQSRKSDHATDRGGQSGKTASCQQNHELIFGGLGSLEELEINDIQHMTTLPESVSDLINLRVLRISWVPVRQLNSIAVLSSVTSLSLRNMDNLISLPAQIKEMRQLTQLYLGGLEILTLPDGLCDLTSLQILHLKHTKNIRSLPANFTALVGLQEFLLQSCTRLIDLPLGLNCLPSLRILRIAYASRMAQLPHCLGQATQLQELQLSGDIPCLRNDRLTLHTIGGLTNLTRLTLGPWEGADFSTSLRRLVKMKKLKLHVQSDATHELRDPMVFHKIAFAISCMPALKKLKITHSTYAPAQSILFDPRQRNLSVTLFSLRAHPRVELRSFGLMRVHCVAPLHTNPTLHGVAPFNTNLDHARVSSMLIHSYMEECDFPLHFANLSNEEILAEWRLSLEKILAFMQGSHLRLGRDAPCANLVSEMFKKIADYTVFRSEYDHVIRGIADL